MLALTRNDGERILLSNGVVVTLVRGEYGRAVVGIDAPSDVKILREEIAPPGFGRPGTPTYYATRRGGVGG